MDAARFWGQQGYDKSWLEITVHLLWNLSPWRTREAAPVDAVAKDACGLGALIDPLREVASKYPSTLTDDRRRYGRIAGQIPCTLHTRACTQTRTHKNEF